MMSKYLQIAIALSILCGKIYAAESAGKATKVASATDELDQSGTKFDFDEATLEGKMKAPPGMTLRGRVEQNKNNLIQLRKEFRANLHNSKAANRALKP